MHEMSKRNKTNKNSENDVRIESSLMPQHSKQLEQSSISTKQLQKSSPASTSSKKRLI
ncbi:hypothetical protein V8B55DRAFT_1541840, partial [Mucor lusitanicus]